MLSRICLGSACLMMSSGVVFSALIVGDRNVDDVGFAIVLAGLVLVSTLLVASLTARVSRLRVDGTSRLD